jgi:hypothetical protein
VLKLAGQKQAGTVQVDIDPLTDPAAIEPIIAKLGPDGGAIFNADAFINNNQKAAVDLAARYRTPAIYGNGSASAKAGCPECVDHDRGGAQDVNKIATSGWEPPSARGVGLGPA